MLRKKGKLVDLMSFQSRSRRPAITRTFFDAKENDTIKAAINAEASDTRTRNTNAM